MPARPSSALSPGAPEHHGGGALVGGAQHPQVQRLAHQPRRQHGGGVDLGAEHGVGVVHAVTTVLHHHRGQMVLGHARVLHEALGPQGEIGRRGAEPRVLLPGLEERRPDHALGHLLQPEDEHGVIGTGADGPGPEHEGGPAAGAARFDVDDGHARHAQARQHLVARRHPAVGGGAEGGLEPAPGDAGVEEGAVHGGHAHVGDGPVLEAAEGVDGDPGHVHGRHDAPPFGVEPPMGDGVAVGEEASGAKA